MRVLISLLLLSLPAQGQLPIGGFPPGKTLPGVVRIKQGGSWHHTLTSGAYLCENEERENQITEELRNTAELQCAVYGQELSFFSCFAGPYTNAGADLPVELCDIVCYFRCE